MLISLSPEVAFFSQLCRTDDFAKQHYLVVDGGDSAYQQQVRFAAAAMGKPSASPDSFALQLCCCSAVLILLVTCLFTKVFRAFHD